MKLTRRFITHIHLQFQTEFKDNYLTSTSPLCPFNNLCYSSLCERFIDTMCRNVPDMTEVVNLYQRYLGMCVCCQLVCWIHVYRTADPWCMVYPGCAMYGNGDKYSYDSYRLLDCQLELSSSSPPKIFTKAKGRQPWPWGHLVHMKKHLENYQSQSF